MQDTVFIKNLEILTVIGVYDHEREKPQRVIIDLEILADLSTAGSNDNLDSTIDYGAIVSLVERLAQNNDTLLLERFGQRLCDGIFQHFSVDQLTLTLHKPDIIQNVKSVGVILRRKRPT
ncbi:MAG: dihydroneopterin aldolase [Pseudomonadota bacterium]